MPRLAYPQDVDLVQFLADGSQFIRSGGHGESAFVVNDAWNVLGFGLGKFKPIPAVGAALGEAPPKPALERFTEEELAKADELRFMGLDSICDIADEQHAKCSEHLAHGGVGNFDWRKITWLAMQMAWKILEQQWFAPPVPEALPAVGQPASLGQRLNYAPPHPTIG